MTGFALRALAGVMLLSTALLLGQGCGQGDKTGSAAFADSYEVNGVVTEIAPSRLYVSIDHEAIPGYMDAMEMFFPVSDSLLLDEVSVSDSVHFKLEVQNGNYAITAMTVMGTSN